MDDVFSIYFNTPIDEDTCDSTMALFEEHLYDDTSRTIPSPTYSLPKYEPSITVSELFNPVTPDNGPYTGPSTETSPGQSTTGLPTTGLPTTGLHTTGLPTTGPNSLGSSAPKLTVIPSMNRKTRILSAGRLLRLQRLNKDCTMTYRCCTSKCKGTLKTTLENLFIGETEHTCAPDCGSEEALITEDRSGKTTVTLMKELGLDVDDSKLVRNLTDRRRRSKRKH